MAAENVDPVEIRQVLVNLLRNACDAVDGSDTQERLITIHAAPAGQFVEVSVVDNGPGLPPHSDLDVFEAGWRSRAKTTTFGMPSARPWQKTLPPGPIITTVRKSAIALPSLLPKNAK